MNLYMLLASTSDSPLKYPGFYLYLLLFVYLPVAGATILFLQLIRFLLRLLPARYSSKLNLESESFAIFPGALFPGLYLILEYTSFALFHRTDEELLAVLAFVMVLIGSQLVPKLLRRKK